MANIVIRHLSGTKAHQVEQIPLQGFREILIGREANANVRFDAERDDLVSRTHARIVRDPADPDGYLLTDLESRNGTFLNRQRIYGASRLQHGDRIQLGPSGPEFSFEIDPPPTARPTRQADQGQAGATREAPLPSTASAIPPGMTDTAAGVSRPVGRGTVERLISNVQSQMKGESRKTMWTAVAGLVVLAIAGAGFFAYQRQQNRHEYELQKLQLDAINSKLDAASAEAATANNKLTEAKKNLEAVSRKPGNPAAMKQAVDAVAAAQADATQKSRALEDAKNLQATAKASTDAAACKAGTGPCPGEAPAMTAEQIASKNTPSVVLVEVTWKLTDVATGQQVYLYHHANALGACPAADNSEYLPVFVSDSAGKLNPVLSTISNEGRNEPIAGAQSGTGFVVSGDGFLLTNRHVLAPWRSNQNTRSFTRKSVGLKVKDGRIVGCINASDFPTNWVPEEGSPLVVDSMQPVAGNQEGEQKVAEMSDRLKYNPLSTHVQGEPALNVTFAKTKQRYAAKTVTLSDKHDVGLAKVDIPSGAVPVTLFADSSAIHVGQQVVVLGYPAISPDVYGVNVSRDMFSTKAHAAAIADPTLSEGPIGKVISSGSPIIGPTGLVSASDVYQLGINTTGAGNSGGPVFDDHGRVIAIFYAGAQLGGASVTYAVPIKFGKELIDNPVSKD